MTNEFSEKVHQYKTFSPQVLKTISNMAGDELEKFLNSADFAFDFGRFPGLPQADARLLYLYHDFRSDYVFFFYESNEVVKDLLVLSVIES